MIDIGILGLGTVGSGVVELLEMNKHIISKRLGQGVNVKKVLVKNLEKRRTSLVEGKLTDDAMQILEDGDISIVVELMGGENPAFDYIKEALNRGKHVVTANKEVIAKHGQELLSLAKDKNVNLLFEASVAGGIPILRPMKQCLAANEVIKVMGILNGTTNYILTQMAEKGESFYTALKEAQAQGFAEADPTDDVKGYDAARKLAILSSIAFNTRITPDKVYTQGIDTLKSVDIDFAKENGYVIKLIGVGKRSGDEVEVSVAPLLLKASHMLASVKDAFNAVMVEGNAVGPLMFYGKGAGMMPTASAVAADIMDVIKHMDRCKNLCTCYDHLSIANAKSAQSNFYVRLEAPKEEDVSAMIKNAFGERQISLVSITSKKDEGERNQVTMIVSQVALNRLEDAIQQLQRDAAVSVANILRMED